MRILTMDEMTGLVKRINPIPKAESSVSWFTDDKLKCIKWPLK